MAFGRRGLSIKEVDDDDIIFVEGLNGKALKEAGR
jgi:hypothetical protein